jgi:2-(1,2-epoxy-1,2-dihydrophenyl)acetyl-CoA isomerase
MFEQILYAVEDGIATITLNRPEKLNAFTEIMRRELIAAFDSVDADDAVRAVIVTGAGRAFCAGADLSAGGKTFDYAARGAIAADQQRRDGGGTVSLRIFQCKKPVIAAVNGPAVGIGCSLALCSDLIMAAESAYFLLAFVNIGLVPDGGSSLFLPTRIGMARATELSMLGERLPAAKALEWGLINFVAPDESLRRDAHALAARMAAGPTRSYAGAKRQLNNWLYARMDEQLELEASIQQEMAGSSDFAEGAMAFLQKRPASFTGS